MHAKSFAELRAQVEAKILAMPDDGEIPTTVPVSVLNQVCFVIMGLSAPGGLEDLRKGDTAEQVLSREDFVAGVAAMFAEEVTQYGQLFHAAVQEFLGRTGPGGTTMEAGTAYVSIMIRAFAYGDPDA